jgi:pyruvate formate lyase activating enzyme
MEMMQIESLCKLCGTCGNFKSLGRQLSEAEIDELVENCPHDALNKVGQIYRPEELFKRIKKNKVFYGEDGGVTFSGGEAMAQPEFVRAILHLCKEEGISVGLETCGLFNWEQCSDFVGDFDFIYFDIKGMDDSVQKQMTGHGTGKIHANLNKLSKVLESEKIFITMTVIPGVNDNEINCKALAEFAKKLKLQNIRLLPYHAFGTDKYNHLGRKSALPVLQMKSGMIEKIRDFFCSRELNR